MPSPLTPSPSEAQYQLAHNSDNRSSQILISHYICLPLATIAVLLRLISRYLCKAGRLQADDYLVISAWVYHSPLMSNVKSSSSVRDGYGNVDMAFEAFSCRGR